MGKRRRGAFASRRQLKFGKWDCVVDMGSKWDVGKGRKILIVGKTGTGKSVMQTYIAFQNHHQLYSGVAMSNVPSSCAVFETYLPRAFVYTEMSEDVIKKMLSTFKELSRDPEWELERWMLVIDDCSETKGVMGTDLFRELFMQSRHYNMFVSLAVQYFVDVAPAVRQNIDWIVIGRETNSSVQKRLFDNIFKDIFEDDRAVFRKTMSHLTSNYSMMALKNIGKETEIEQLIFSCKADLNVPPFHIGDDDHWIMDGMTVAREASRNALDMLANMMPQAGSAFEDEDEDEGEDSPRSPSPIQEGTVIDPESGRVAHVIALEEPSTRVERHGGHRAYADGGDSLLARWSAAPRRHTARRRTAQKKKQQKKKKNRTRRQSKGDAAEEGSMLASVLGELDDEEDVA